jgi:predicted membrane-bound dolichyl-phosphate-mannose-protein mannosyltransferase
MSSVASAKHWVFRHEALVVYTVGVLAFAAVPVLLGHLGLSWDALNHHIYLGWTAEHSRLDRDLVAAGYQAYQYPYLYWPIYKLAVMGATGVTAGVVLAVLNSIAIPPVWSIARDCIAAEDAFGLCMRGVAVALAFLTGAVLSLFDATSNDLLAGIPLLWAYAAALRPIADARLNSLRWSIASGVLGGLSVAFKLSNGFVAVVLPLLWMWPSGGLMQRGVRVALAGACLVASSLLVYGYWGWQMWSHFGNPIYPLYDNAFEGLRGFLRWQQ